MLANIINLVSGCVTFLGGIIIAAAVYFGMLDTSWLPA